MGQNSTNRDLKDFPIRTIYFESPCAFPEINSFTYDAASTWVKLFLPFYFLNYYCHCSVGDMGFWSFPPLVLLLFVLLNLEACPSFKTEQLMIFFLSSYGLQIDTIRSDFKSGLEALLKDKPIRAIFLGVRIGDPTAVPLFLKHGYFILF